MTKEFIVFLAGLVTFSSANAAASAEDEIDPMIGTEGIGSEYGGMMPMTGVPFGSMQLVPMTRECKVSQTSFNALDTELKGFILTRQPAIWMGEWGAVRVRLPKPLRIESIDAHPWRTIVCAGGHTYELYASSHAAAIRSDDPALGKDLPAEGFSTEKEDAYYGVATPNYRAWFVTERRDDVLRIGVSLISAEDARRNLAEEVPGDVAALEAATRARWHDHLGRIAIETRDPSVRRVFSTALYHALHYPRETTERGRYWSAFDDRVHEGTGYTCYSLWDTYRSEHALLTLVASERVDGMMQSLVNACAEGGWLPKWPNPGYTGTMIGAPAEMVLAEAWAKGFRGFDVKAAYAAVKKNATVPQEGDRTCRWSGRRVRSNNPPETRGGLSFYQTLGYVPVDRTNESVSRTQDFALDDAACAVLADAVGATADVAYFRARSHSWTNLWNAAEGMFWPRLSTGEFVDPEPDPVTRRLRYDWPYTECGKDTATWCVPHDAERLIGLLGGRERFVAKLDRYFNGPFFKHDAAVGGNLSLHGNESGHHIAYLYNFAGRPDLTQRRVRQILTRCYSASRRGFDGNEDCGAMSAWYVLSALGLYPVNPASGRYELGSPLVDRAVIRIGAPFKPAVFEIVAHNQSPQNWRVAEVRLNGRRVEGHSIAHADIVRGGRLEFDMRAE